MLWLFMPQWLYESFLSEVPLEVRDSAPRLGNDEDPLAGSIQLRMFLIADPQPLELLGQAR